MIALQKEIHSFKCRVNISHLQVYWLRCRGNIYFVISNGYISPNKGKRYPIYNNAEGYICNGGYRQKNVFAFFKSYVKG